MTDDGDKHTDNGVSLVTAIAQLKREILATVEAHEKEQTEARADGRADVQMQLNEVEMEFSVQHRHAAGGEASAGWRLFNAQGEGERTRSHTVKLNWRPFVINTDGRPTRPLAGKLSDKVSKRVK